MCDSSIAGKSSVGDMRFGGEGGEIEVEEGSVEEGRGGYES